MHMRHVTLEVRFEQKDPRVTHARWGSSFRAGKKDMMIFDFSLIDPHEAFYVVMKERRSYLSGLIHQPQATCLPCYVSCPLPTSHQRWSLISKDTAGLAFVLSIYIDSYILLPSS